VFKGVGHLGLIPLLRVADELLLGGTQVVGDPAEIWIGAGQVQRDEPVRMVERELLQYAGAEVAAASAKPRVAELGHDFDDDVGDSGEVHATLPRAVTEAVAGQRYHHHIEGGWRR
jgi:hypothetical protein